MRKTFLIAFVATLAALAIGVGSATAGSLITSKQVKDHSLKVKDLRKNAVNKLRGHNGATGAQGLQGLQGLPGKNGVDGKPGDKGDKGDRGLTGASAAESAHTVTQVGSLGVGITSVTASCEPTESVLGGGYSVGIANKDATPVVLDNKPTSGDNGWTVRGYKVDAPNTNGVGSVPVTVYAVCAA